MMPAADSALLLTAFATGMLGSTHCVGMCGGISAALSFALPAEKRRGAALFGYQLAYNLGRIASYTLLGVIVGVLAQGVLGSWAASPWPRVFAGLFMVALGLYLAGWWLGLRRIESAGGGVWKMLEPLRRSVLPVDRPWKALVAGGVWGFLPCGLVYSALALALARADALLSGGVMLAFGLGTLPALLLTGTFAARVRSLLQQSGARRLAGLLVIVFGVWTAAEPLLMRHMKHGEHGSGDHGGHRGPSAGHEQHTMPAPALPSGPSGAETETGSSSSDAMDHPHHQHGN